LTWNPSFYIYLHYDISYKVRCEGLHSSNHDEAEVTVDGFRSTQSHTFNVTESGANYSCCISTTDRTDVSYCIQTTTLETGKYVMFYSITLK